MTTENPIPLSQVLEEDQDIRTGGTFEFKRQELLDGSTEIDEREKCFVEYFQKLSSSPCIAGVVFSIVKRYGGFYHEVILIESIPEGDIDQAIEIAGNASVELEDALDVSLRGGYISMYEEESFEEVEEAIRTSHNSNESDLELLQIIRFT